MAYLWVPLTELTTIAKRNDYLPEQIEDLEAEGDSLRVSIQTGLPIIGVQSFKLTLDSYGAGVVRLKVSHNGITDRIFSVIKLKKTGLYQFSYPYIDIFIEKFLAEKVLGLEIANVEIRDVSIIIETRI